MGTAGTHPVVEMAKDHPQERISQQVVPQVTVQRRMEQFFDVRTPLVVEQIGPNYPDHSQAYQERGCVSAIDVERYRGDASMPRVVKKIVEVVSTKDALRSASSNSSSMKRLMCDSFRLETVVDHPTSQIM